MAAARIDCVFIVDGEDVMAGASRGRHCGDRTPAPALIKRKPRVAREVRSW
jgi:hypothetical protein